MPLKIKIASFVADGFDEVSEVTMDIDRIVFDGARMRLVRKDEVQAELVIAAVKEIELVPKNPPIEQLRAKHPRAYEPWDSDEEQQLIELFTAGTKPAIIAKELQRQTSAIRSRLRKLGYDEPPTDEALDYADDAEA